MPTSADNLKLVEPVRIELTTRTLQVSVAALEHATPKLVPQRRIELRFSH